jgi:hypothetical protein
MIDIADIAPTFAFVLHKGFVPGPAIDRPLEFGNAEVELNGQPFSLRLTRERGQILADIGTTSSGWYKLEYVLEFVDRSVTQIQFGEPPDAAIMSDLLQRNWDEVAKVFVDELAMRRLHEFARQRSAALLGAIFPKR